MNVNAEEFYDKADEIALENVRALDAINGTTDKDLVAELAESKALIERLIEASESLAGTLSWSPAWEGKKQKWDDLVAEARAQSLT